MTRFKRTSSEPYKVITPLTSLVDLEEFLKTNIFALGAHPCFNLETRQSLNRWIVSHRLRSQIRVSRSHSTRSGKLCFSTRSAVASGYVWPLPIILSSNLDLLLHVRRIDSTIYVKISVVVLLSWFPPPCHYALANLGKTTYASFSGWSKEED